MKNTMIVAALFAVVTLGALRVTAEDAEKEVTIKDVMNKAMKGKDSLVSQVAKGEGTKADAEKLVELFTALSQQEPPKGDAESWEAKTDALLAAAKACAAGEEGAPAKLGAAANCKACHTAHKGK